MTTGEDSTEVERRLSEGHRDGTTGRRVKATLVLGPRQLYPDLAGTTSKAATHLHLIMVRSQTSTPPSQRYLHNLQRLYKSSKIYKPPTPTPTTCKSWNAQCAKRQTPSPYWSILPAMPLQNAHLSLSPSSVVSMPDAPSSNIICSPSSQFPHSGVSSKRSTLGSSARTKER